MVDSAIAEAEPVSDRTLRGAIAFYFLLMTAPVAFVIYFGGLAWVVRWVAEMVAG